MSSNARDIKRAQKESLLLRELSELFRRIIADEPSLQQLYVTRTALSDDKSVCTIYFHTAEGKKGFDTHLGTLKLYKPSIRTALAKTIPGRYTPQLIFKYDAPADKQMRVETLLNKVSSELVDDEE